MIRQNLHILVQLINFYYESDNIKEIFIIIRIYIYKCLKKKKKKIVHIIIIFHQISIIINKTRTKPYYLIV